jgi:signal transduction histidine kinase
MTDHQPAASFHGSPHANKMFRAIVAFTRLHNHVEGSGIGLYIIKRIVKNYQGRIDVDSQPGEGTTFKVYLPQAQEKENAG